jgi:Ca2+-transporting ATPase
MVTDTFPALALALEPADTDVMARPPRDPRDAILSRQFLSRVGFYAALITATTLTAFVSYVDRPLARAQTVAFMTLAFAQLFHLGTARSDRPVFHLKTALANPYAIGAMILSIALQFVALYVDPLPRVLGLTPLSANDWYVILAFAVVPAAVGQAIRVVSSLR